MQNDIAKASLYVVNNNPLADFPTVITHKVPYSISLFYLYLDHIHHLSTIHLKRAEILSSRNVRTRRWKAKTSIIRSFAFVSSFGLLSDSTMFLAGHRSWRHHSARRQSNAVKGESFLESLISVRNKSQRFRNGTTFSISASTRFYSHSARVHDRPTCHNNGRLRWRRRLGEFRRFYLFDCFHYISFVKYL